MAKVTLEQEAGFQILGWRTCGNLRRANTMLIHVRWRELLNGRLLRKVR